MRRVVLTLVLFLVAQPFTRIPAHGHGIVVEVGNNTPHNRGFVLTIEDAHYFDCSKEDC